MKNFQGLIRSAGTIGGLTFLSRILGYVRDMVVAYFFGAAAITDAFYVAFRIPNLLRRLFAEGSLTISFIPVFTEYLEKHGSAEAKRVSDATFTSLVIVLSIVTMLGIIFSPLIIKLFAFGFSPETFELAVAMNRMMFPYIFFISLVALVMGILNSLRHFFAPAFSPVLLNISIIAAVVGLHGALDVPIYAAALGVLIGGVAQLIFNFPFLKLKGFMFAFSREIFHPAVKRIAKLMTPQLFGLAVYNVNILVSTQLASFMPVGTISYLYYSERLIEFPLGIIAVSISMVLLPALSRNAVRGETDKYREQYTQALRLMLFIMVPALIGLIVLRVPIVSLLYQRGELDYQAVIYTSEALLGYAVGIWAVGGVRITAPMFYALQDTKTPVVVAFFTLIINAAAGFLLGFVFELRHFGLALASSLSSVFYFVVLFILINRRMGSLGIGESLIPAAKMFFAAAIMGVVGFYVSGFASWDESGDTLYKAFVLSAAVLSSAAVYFALARLFGISEARQIWAVIKNKPND